MAFGAWRVWLVCAVFFMLGSSLSAQWLEKSILLPDSLTATTYPQALCYVASDNTVYVGGQQAILVLDASTGNSLARIPVSYAVTALCLNRTHDRVYAALDAHSVLSVDVATRRVLKEIDLGYYASELVCSETADRVFVSNANSSENSVVIIDCTRDSVVGSVSGFGQIDDICLNAAGNRLYVADENLYRVYVLDCATGAFLDSIWTGNGPFTLLYNPISDKLYCSDQSDEDVAIINALTDSVIRFLSLDGSTAALAFNPLLNSVYCVTSPSEVSVISGTGDSVIGLGYCDGVTSRMSFDASADVLCVASPSLDRVVLIDGADYSILGIVPVGLSPQALAYCPGAGRVYVVSRTPASLAALDCSTRRVVASRVLGISPEVLGWSADANRLYCVDYESSCIVVVDGSSNQPGRVLLAGHYIGAVVPIPGENKVYCCGGLADTAIVTVIGQPGDTISRELRFPGPISGVAYNPSGRKLYCLKRLSASSAVQVVDCRTDSLIRTILLPKLPWAMTFDSQDNRLFLSEDSAVRVFEAVADTQIAVVRIPAHLYSIGYVPGHNYVVVACAEPYGLAFIDAAACTLVTVVPLAGMPGSMPYSARSDRLYFMAAAGELMAIDCAQRMVTDSLAVTATGPGMTLDTIADRLYLNGGGWLEVVDCGENRTVALLSVPSGSTAPTWNPLNRRMYVPDWDASALLVFRDSAVTGVGEAAHAATRRWKMPSIVRGVLKMPPAANLLPPAALLDISGRKVLDLQPGPNDISRLGAGVYFISERTGARSTRPVMTKVIVAR